MLDIYIQNIGLIAPGLLGWQQSKQILQQQQDYIDAPLEKYKPELLPPNERRRATKLVRLAFQAAEDAVKQSTINPAELATVFSSSGGDYPIIDQICQAITEPERMVSPTQFHNSVHNSAAGYWSIAVGSTLPSNSLSAHNSSFAMGLLEAAMLVASEQQGCLYACYDTAAEGKLLDKRPIHKPFGMAFILSQKPQLDSVAHLRLNVLDTQQAESCLRHPELQELYNINPSAKALSLLEVLALQEKVMLSFDLPTMGQCLQVEVLACS